MKFKSEVQLEALNNAPTDTDKFLVSDSSTVKYRTGAQVLSDLSACKAVNLTVATASATAAKVTTESVIFEEGALYLIKFTLGNSISSPTLNGINIRLGTSNASTTTFSIGNGTIVPMYYNATNNVMQITGSYRTSDSTEDYNLRWENSVQAGEEITRYKIIMEGIDGRFWPLTIGNTTAATKTVSTQEFRLDGTILMYNSTATVAANAVFTNVYVSEYFTTTNYTFNQSSGFIAYRSVYLVGTVNSNGNFVLDNTTLTSWLTQTLPTTDDGKVYIYLGITNNTFTAFRLEVTHPIYQYKNGKLGLYSSIENPTTGTGTLNFVSKFTSTGSTLGDSQIFDNGTSVLIGTSTPPANNVKFYVYEPSTPTISAYFQNNNATCYTGYHSSGTTLNSVRIGASGNNLVFSVTPDGSPNERMRITSAGDVGIGTTDPSSLLNVYGDLHLGSWLNSSTVNIENRTGKSVFYISTDGVNNAVGTTITYSWASGGQGPLKFNNASGEVMRLDASNGKLGVGTTNPTSRVHSVTNSSGPVSYDNRCAVFGYNTATETTFNNAVGIAGRVLTSGGRAVYGDATTGGGWGGYFDGKGYFSGNVGIGTTTSSYPLDVNGIAMLRGNLYMTAGGSSSIPNWSFSINGSGDLVVDESITTKNFIFSNSGQVLIGTTVGGTPTYGSAPQFVTSSPTGGVIDIRSLNTNIVADSLLGRIQFTGKDDLSVAYTSAAIEAVSAGSPNQGSNGGGTLKFMTSLNGYSTNPLPRMWISYLGYVTIGSTNTNSYPLRVTTQVSNTSIYADYDIVAYSDQSVKENIRPIENSLERVINSRGVLYDRIDSGEKDNIGFIAQELEVEFPELVVTNEDGTKAVKYQNTVAVLFEAIKEQQKQIEELKQLLNGITN
jgi:hypothetical protein